MPESTAESSAQTITTDDVIKAFGRLGTLTYQQRQMVKDGDVLPLLDQFSSAQKGNNWFYLAIIFALGLRCLFGLFERQLHWISGLVAAVVLLHMSKQKTTVAEVEALVRQFADQQGYQAPTRESLLLTELRTGYSLTYDQHQMLKAGEVVTLATQIVKTTKQSARVQSVVMTFCFLPQMWSTFSNVTSSWNVGQSAWLHVLLSVAYCLITFGFVSMMGISQLRKARRLEEIIGEHEADQAAGRSGTELESDRDSPYRSPMFR